MLQQRLNNSALFSATVATETVYIQQLCVNTSGENMQLLMTSVDEELQTEIKTSKHWKENTVSEVVFMHNISLQRLHT